MSAKYPSRTIVEGRDRAPARAMLKAIGFGDGDLRRPIIGVANTWIVSTDGVRPQSAMRGEYSRSMLASCLRRRSAP